jgi:hypothetical protein
MIEIRRCRPEEFDALSGFWNERQALRGPSDSSQECIRELRRRTFENPIAQAAGTSWIAWEDGEAVAHLGVVPCPAYHLGRKIESNWWCDFYAAPDSGARCSPQSAAGLLVLKVASIRQGHALIGTPGIESRVVQLYKSLRCDYWGAVPFFYQVINGWKFLRNLPLLRRGPSTWTAKAANAASYLWAPGKLLELRHRRRASPRPMRVEIWSRFPSQADRLWQKVVKQYPLIFERSARHLNWRYHSAIYERLGIFHENRLAGWAVGKATQMHGNPYFGDLKVGTLVDLLVHPDDALDVEAVMGAACERLRELGVDLIVTNLSDGRLTRAARRLGFAAGPSNYHFYTRNLPKLKLHECHLTRGDSDGDSRL